MIGLGTYAFLWQHSKQAPVPMDLPAMLRQTRELDVDLFQICDYPALSGYTNAELRDLKLLADELGIVLELGTRGISVDHLHSVLHSAELLGARLVRSMVNTADHRPGMVESQRLLEQALPAYEASGVKIALETYEQINSRDLVALVETIGSKFLGICLDPANCVAALENPVDVIDRCAPYVLNIHVKDFAFRRREGWVGFTLEGAELGTGLLDYDHLLRRIDPESRGINQIVEHWLPWQGTFEQTQHLENQWTFNNLTFLRKQKS